MVDAGEAFYPEPGEIEFLLGLEGGLFFPFRVLPPDTRLGDLLDVGDGIEVGGEGVAVRPAVTVEDVERVDVIENPGGVRGEDVGDARVEPDGEQGGQAGFLKAVVKIELPLVGKHLVAAGNRLGSRGVDVVGPGDQAGLHHGQVLLGKSGVEYNLATILADERRHCPGITGIEGGGVHRHRSGQPCRNPVALVPLAACDGDPREEPGLLRSLDRHHIGNTAGADDENPSHGGKIFGRRRVARMKTGAPRRATGPDSASWLSAADPSPAGRTAVHTA